MADSSSGSGAAAGRLVRPGLLKILVEGARGLESLVTAGRQAPYYVLECGAQRCRSKPAGAGTGTDPVWKTAHKFALSGETAVRVTVKDDVTKGVVGQAVIDLAAARAAGRDEGAVALATPGGLRRGTLSFKLKFTAAEGMDPVPAAPLEPAGAGGSVAGESAATGGGGTDALSLRPSASFEYDSSVHRSGSGALLRGGSGVSAAAAAAGAAGAAAVSGGGEDATLRSVQDKVSLAKMAMQQLQAEIEEMAGGGGAGAGAGGSAASGSVRGDELTPRAAHPLPSPTGSASTGRSAPFGRPENVSLRSLSSGATAATAATAAAGAGAAAATTPKSPAPAKSPAAAAAAPDAAEASAAAAAGEAAMLEDIVAQYSKTAADAAAAGAGAAGAGGRGLLTSKALCEALEALHAEKAAADEELAGVKRAMAEMTQQHYADLRRAREAAGGASPRTPGGGGGGGFAPPKSPASASTAAAGRTPGTGRASSSSARSGGGGGGASAGNPVAAHRLEIQIHQHERTIAEQAARIEAQAEEMRSLLADLDTARGAGREAAARADAAVEAAEERAAAAERRLEALEKTADAARAEAAAARGGAEAAGAKEAALAAELAELKRALAAAEAERSGAEQAAAAADGVSQRERARADAELAALREEVAALKAGAAGAAEARKELEAARAKLAASKAQAEEVEYLQQQVLWEMGLCGSGWVGLGWSWTRVNKHSKNTLPTPCIQTHTCTPFAQNNTHKNNIKQNNSCAARCARSSSCSATCRRCARLKARRAR